MISNKQILQEVERLKINFKNGDVEVPNMWRCFTRTFNNGLDGWLAFDIIWVENVSFRSA